MKYAREVIDCMSAHPGREFKMAELIRYCCGNVRGMERRAAHLAIWRVLKQLVDSRIITEHKNGRASSLYTWP